MQGERESRSPEVFREEHPRDRADQVLAEGGGFSLEGVGCINLRRIDLSITQL